MGDPVEEETKAPTGHPDGSRPHFRDAGATLKALRLQADRRLDTVGLYCPVPIIKTAARIREMQPGEVLEVISDDRVILLDMPAWCLSAGHEFLGQFEEGGEIRLFVKKLGRGAPVPPRRR